MVSAYNEWYSYDQIGNLIEKGGVSQRYGSTWQGTGTGPHRLVANNLGGNWQTYGYDANGNLQSGNGRTYTWNAANQPSSITAADGLTETYRYNADGERVMRTRGGQNTVYAWGVWEVTQGVQTRKLYQFGGQVVAIREVESGKVSYLHGDHLGSVSVTTDQNGNLQSRQEYDPWGNVRSGNVGETTLDYTGQRRDDTGLLFYNARYYDPAIGRFISADSVVLESEVTGVGPATLDLDSNKGQMALTVDFHESQFREKLQEEQHQGKLGFGPVNPQALNRYSYVANNPLRYTDPTGHPFPCQFKGCRATFDISSWPSWGKKVAKAACFLLGCDVDTEKGVFKGPSPEESITGMMPMGSVVKFGDISGGRITVKKALEMGEKWLGPGYKEIAEGVFRSADNLRQFRMTEADLLDLRQGVHVHFESIGSNGREIMENSHVYLIDP